MSRSCTRRGKWRLVLRDKRLLEPPAGRIKDIDRGVMSIVEEHWQSLTEAWDAKYPENPVSSAEDETDGDDE